MYEWRVHVFEDWHSDPLGQTVRLYFVRRTHAGVEVMFADQTIRTYPEGQSAAEDAGFTIPRDAMPALLQGLSEWQGKANDGRTEVAVLREWLAVERARVDAALVKGPAS